MADISQTREARSDKGRWYFLAILIGAGVIAVVAAVTIGILPYSKEAPASVSHVGDHTNTMSMGHLLLTEWEVSALSSVLSQEVKPGRSTLEVHNDGQTVHRLAIWRGGVVEGDQVVGGTLVAETEYIRPGKMTTMDLELESGEYVLVCTVRGHLARGMYATVKAGNSEIQPPRQGS